MADGFGFWRVRAAAPLIGPPARPAGRALVALGAVAGTVALMVSACGSVSVSVLRPPTSAPAHSSTSTPTAATSSAVATPTPTGTQLTAAGLETALLTSSEVGAGFTEGVYSNEESALPCDAANAPTLDQQFPPAVTAGRESDDATVNATFDEEIDVYQDAVQSAAVLAAATKGLACGQATVHNDDGTSDLFTISAPQDDTATVDVSGIDSVTDWTITSDDESDVLVAARLGASLILFDFAAPADVQDSQLPDVGDVVTAALTKVIHA